jgi:RNA polymerase sigma-70 factor (ECF subfamily)
LLSKVDRAKGRFRSFLLRSLKNYLLDQIKHEHARKRTADNAGSLGERDVLQADGEPPSDIFDVAWARTVLERTIRRMREETFANDQQSIWAVFEARLLRPLIVGGEPTTYEKLVEQFGFDSPKQAASALITAKRRFNRILRSIIREYVEDDDVDQEIANLRATLAAAGTLAADFEAMAGLPQTSAALAPEGDSLHDISQAQLVVLEEMFRLTSQRDLQWEAEELAAMWQHLLAQPLEDIAAGHPLYGKTAADLLESDDPPLPTLESLKREYGNYARSLKSPLPTKISTVFYFTTIAAALVRHSARISSSPDAVLREGFDITLAETFLDDRTRSLVAQAAAMLGMAQS